MKAGNAWRAAGVSRNPWLKRSKSGRRIQASSDLTCWATAAGVTPSSCAAAAKLS